MIGFINFRKYIYNLNIIFIVLSMLLFLFPQSSLAFRVENDNVLRVFRNEIQEGLSRAQQSASVIEGLYINCFDDQEGAKIALYLLQHKDTKLTNLEFFNLSSFKEITNIFSALENNDVLKRIGFRSYRFFDRQEIERLNQAVKNTLANNNVLVELSVFRDKE